MVLMWSAIWRGCPGYDRWGPEFSAYAAHNIVATQRLLEGCKQHPVRKFIYASTSSVYGEQSGRVDESAKTEPLSPYGVSKLTGEQLCRVYLHNDGIPVTVLRFLPYMGRDSGRIWLFTVSFVKCCTEIRLRCMATDARPAILRMYRIAWKGLPPRSLRKEFAARY